VDERHLEREGNAWRKVEIALDRLEAQGRKRKVVLRGTQLEEYGAPVFIGIHGDGGGDERGVARLQLDAHRGYGQLALVDHRDFDLEACLRRAGPCDCSKREQSRQGKSLQWSQPFKFLYRYK
jgi:hypothetical protein